MGGFAGGDSRCSLVGALGGRAGGYCEGKVCMVVRAAAGRALRLTRSALVHPVAKAAAASCVINCASDVNCQLLTRWMAQRKFGGGGGLSPTSSYLAGFDELDRGRCARFAVVGLTLHGPYFSYAFPILDAWLGPARTLGAVLKKSAVGNLTVFPVYLAAFYLYMGLLEGKRGDELKQKFSAFIPSYAIGWAFWLPVNMLNFKVVPAGFGRVLYINGMGLVWNTYLSYVNSAGASRQVRDGQQLVKY